MKKIKTYSSGLRLVVDTLNNFPSVVCSIRVGTGSINDFENKSGISHFIEHMIFKGTKTKSAKEIACCFEELGAEINAYTSHYFTNYYAKCVREDLSKVFEQLCDIFKNSVFSSDEIEKEKGVVIEEIAMQSDEPFSLVTNLLDQNIFTSKCLQNDILGTIESVSSITREDILNYIKKYYVANNIVVSFSGKISLEEAENLTEIFFSEYTTAINAKPIIFAKGNEKFNFEKSVVLKDKKTEQAHVMIAYQTEDLYSSINEKLNVLSKIFGGSMSSRLFQAIRENLGLVYSIFSLNNLMTSCGMFVIYFATTAKNVDVAISAIDEEILKIKKEGVSKTELEKAKKLIRNELIMSKEKLKNINSKSSKELFIFGKERKDSVILKKIENISSNDILVVANQIFKEKRLIAIVGDNVSQQIKTK